jgi:hypothetical protein
MRQVYSINQHPTFLLSSTFSTLDNDIFDKPFAIAMACHFCIIGKQFVLTAFGTGSEDKRKMAVGRDLLRPTALLRCTSNKASNL